MARILYLEAADTFGGSVQSLLVALRAGLSARHACTVGFYHDVPGREAYCQNGVGVESVHSRIASAPLARVALRGYRLKHLPEALFGVGAASRWLEGLLRGPEFALYVLPLARAVTGVMARHQVELVHLNNDPAGNLDGMLAAARGRVPCVCHLRSNRGLSALEAHLARRKVTRFVAVSHAVKRQYARLGLPEDRIDVIYNGREPIARDPAAEGETRCALGTAPKDVAFAFAGRLMARKGVGVLLEAAGLLANVRDDFRIWVVGSGPESAAWIKEAEQRRVQGLVRFLGYRQDVPSVFAAADVVVVPSTYADPMPSTVLEAMAAGRPVIASRIGGIPEAVDHGNTGVLVEPGVPEALARSMSRLMDAPDARAAMGRRALQRLTVEFSPVQCADSIDGVYRLLLEEHRTKRGTTTTAQANGCLRV